jgi:SAM-dependent methyltransferase
MQNNSVELFINEFSQSFEAGEFVKLTLSKQRIKQSDLKSILVSPVQLKGTVMLHFVYRYQTRDITKNYPLTDAIHHISTSIQNDFLQADMYIKGLNTRLLISREGNSKILHKRIELPAKVDLSHDRARGRIIDTHGNIWLRELGVVNEQWELRHEMKDKFVQINRYIELLEPEIDKLDQKDRLKIADMGAGKGYLTFALYDYLINKSGMEIQMTGVEFREDLVVLCNAIARKAGFDKLEFIKGTIEDTPLANLDILIALHACDTATDDAIYRGIASNARLIVCAPCCHKQIRKSINATEPLSGVLKHGILLERQAELLTDGIRALLLEAFGYSTKVFEFISSEHTAKNVMIVGRKTPNTPDKKKILEQVNRIKEIYGIESHYLEELLGV